MRTGPLRVLVADDDPTITLLMQAVLSGDEFAATVVDNGRAALEAFRNAPYDLVLLDVEMPEMDGFAVCAEIRRSTRPATPVVLVSSHDDAAFRQRVAECAAGYIAKPVDWQGLKSMLREYC